MKSLNNNFSGPTGQKSDPMRSHNTSSRQGQRQGGGQQQPLNHFVEGKIYPGIISSISPHNKGIKLLDGDRSEVAYMNCNLKYNRKMKKTFQVGDKVHALVTSQAKRFACLTKEYVQPLIILDVNGILGEREPYDPSNPKKRRSFAERPHAQGLFQHVSVNLHFELALWSCAKDPKVPEIVIPSDQLAFQWSQREVTDMSPLKSVVSTKKPLFYKELSKVWQR